MSIASIVRPPSLWAPSPVGGSSPYIAKAVHFDGSASLWINSLSCVDNHFWSYVLWFKVAADQVGFPQYASDPDNQDDNLADFTGGDPSGICARFFLGAGSSFFNLKGPSSFNPILWHSIVFSADLTNPSGSRKAKLYFDDIDVTNIFTDTGVAGITLLSNGLKFLFGDDGFGDLITGDFADVRIMPGVSLLDGSGDIPLATRRLFTDGSNKPVDPATATAALGFAGTILFSGDSSTFPVNQGTGGTFTLTGTLTNASTSPSD